MLLKISHRAFHEILRVWNRGMAPRHKRASGRIHVSVLSDPHSLNNARVRLIGPLYCLSPLFSYRRVPCLIAALLILEELATNSLQAQGVLCEPLL